MAGVRKSEFLKLLHSGKFSDLTIVCGSDELKVHKNVVCAASPMVDAACSGQFEEAQTGRVKLPDFEPGIVRRVILFLYTGNYDAEAAPSFGVGDAFKEPKGKAKEETDLERFFKKLEVHAYVYKAADFLGIEALKPFAAGRFLSNAATVLMEPEFFKPLRLVYESTSVDDYHLRRPLTCLCVKNHALIANHPHTIDVLQKYEQNVWDVAVPLLIESDTLATTATKPDKVRELHVDVNRVRTLIWDWCQCKACDSYNLLERMIVRSDNSISVYCTKPKCPGVTHELTSRHNYDGTEFVRATSPKPKK